VSESAIDRAEAIVRFQGASFREHLAKLAVGVAPDMILLVAKRMMWELADYVLEVHGPLAVKEMLGEADAAIQIDLPPPIVIPEEVEPDPFMEMIRGAQASHDGMREAFTGLANIILARMPVPAPMGERR
jgi:hypothetical protein